MKPEIVLAFEFVEFIPDKLNEHTLYISTTYGTAVHKCFCGCGREVVTPLSPTAWQMTFDGVSVSLHPSVGSWSLPCQSHYIISKNRVVWAPQWTKEQIARGQAHEAQARERYFETVRDERSDVAARSTPSADKPKQSFWGRIKRWFLGDST